MVDGRLGEQRDQAAFELPDIRRDVQRDKFNHLMGKLNAVFGALFPKDRYSRFEIGRLDICGEAGLKTR